MSTILLGKNPSGTEVNILLSMLNRHGIVAGATGTGKTVTLQIMAESFANAGIPVFAADIKGDLSGVAKASIPSDKLKARIDKLGLTNYQSQANPVLFWDIYGKAGLPLRTTVSELGPTLFANLLNVSDVQEGVLQIAFKVADDNAMLLLDLKDLKALLQWIDENRDQVSAQYGRVTSASISALQRELLVLEQSGGDKFFGEPALQLDHLMQKDFSGKAVISLLDATTLINSPRIYCTFLLWLLSELFEQLPELGDAPLPKLVFFFDEAHLLFESASPVLMEKIEQLVRLIRSKGVGVFFVTQHPGDIPDKVSAQLGTRVQHALRAFTPKEQSALKTAAQSFRPNPAIKPEEILPLLAVGEALISTLDAQGVPSMVEHCVMCPPKSQIGPVSDSERSDIIKRSPFANTYNQTIDRESAYEQIRDRSVKMAGSTDGLKKSTSNRQGAGETFFKSILRTAGSSIARIVINSVLGSGSRSRSRNSNPLGSIVRSVGGSAGRQIMRGVLGGIIK